MAFAPGLDGSSFMAISSGEIGSHSLVGWGGRAASAHKLHCARRNALNLVSIRITFMRVNGARKGSARIQLPKTRIGLPKNRHIFVQLQRGCRWGCRWGMSLTYGS